VSIKECGLFAPVPVGCADDAEPLNGEEDGIAVAVDRALAGVVDDGGVNRNSCSCDPNPLISLLLLLISAPDANVIGGSRANDVAWGSTRIRFVVGSSSVTSSPLVAPAAAEANKSGARADPLRLRSVSEDDIDDDDDDDDDDEDTEDGNGISVECVISGSIDADDNKADDIGAESSSKLLLAPPFDPVVADDDLVSFSVAAPFEVGESTLDDARLRF
jgi:hypothetical protein